MDSQTSDSELRVMGSLQQGLFLALSDGGLDTKAGDLARHMRCALMEHERIAMERGPVDERVASRGHGAKCNGGGPNRGKNPRGPT